MQSAQAFLTEQLYAEHSKPQTMRLVQWIGYDPERWAALMHIFLGDEYRLTQRAAWVLRYAGEKAPDMVAPWLPQLAARLRHPHIHGAVKRNILNLFEYLEIPEDQEGDLADCCFAYLANPQEAIAVRALAITILDKICLKEPELRPEFHWLLEEHMDHATAAFKSRARKILSRKY